MQNNFQYYFDIAHSEIKSRPYYEQDNSEKTTRIIKNENILDYYKNMLEYQ